MSTEPLIIYLDEVHNEVCRMEACMDCASRVLILVEDGEWEVTLGHSETCPVVAARARAGA